MSSLQCYVAALNENDRSILEGAKKVLITLCENIVKNPTIEKYRRVRLNNVTISEKLLPAAGAMECLFEVGFVEKDDHLLLPPNATLSKVEELCRLLSTPNVSNKPEDIKNTPDTENVLPPTTDRGAVPKMLLNVQEHKFIQRIQGYFRDVLKYDNLSLQKEARSLVPLTELTLKAINKLRLFQREIKSSTNGIQHGNWEEITLDDLIFVELLHWFKEDFFTWVDSPPCNKCLSKCNFDRVVKSSRRDVSRIEIHKCNACGLEVEFPRYTDPAPLLKHRRGRCGEWANTFSLICRSLGYDVRLVYDETDHVWTEVWSVSAGKWIHADPCENVLNRPLMYERGWGKKLTYVIACSQDEVQDVTWRYTRDPSSILKRRNLCSENNLIGLIRRLNEERQNSPGYSAARRKFVTKRSLMELVEMLPPPPGKVKPFPGEDEEFEGRTSGSLAWRLARGEVQEKKHESHQWVIPVEADTFRLTYSTPSDTYEVSVNNGTLLDRRTGALEGTDMYSGVHRKVEEDWRMAYLSRSPGVDVGTIKWTILTTDWIASINSIELKAVTATFNENAMIKWTLELYIGDKQLNALSINDSTVLRFTESEHKVDKIILTATLSGGHGDLAWQHAQLFRQDLASKDHAMTITIKINKDS
ncbi:peptide-N(4)-(N-acetyl-beta-glucosaminyl)asparagine amidase [Orussus abietinus]|uniref:peptide-N(4)-(N-acetyl-beta- glucosaminyl)asparagine amidase n=1 Tax=Orussus abietinus TaxID=222816 RepID=UPI000626AE70|nr:peptide-N(4)-(N-acetyl-beta-glucosaminyl)asparagine amidase [Orussus abietinus]XP_012288899.1 peptide-N(4)-(N-acetyl-beta-glucosaminyl)asparagine amidase [Orussus abietinus]XP_012288900.1 peptide-N(4)-(N-acetyl-beta-glucosaminyl)asparagine amidase [Orussus abietinus]XP_023288525.1 peptide-N(4)-(N-acetyl-beta-glucosaminyl)asparagine amidase [Orussus abietinus]